eukprot:359339-Chlamydomonas_euryale.AAC.2
MAQVGSDRVVWPCVVWRTQLEGLEACEMSWKAICSRLQPVGSFGMENLNQTSLGKVCNHPGSLTSSGEVCNRHHWIGAILSFKASRRCRRGRLPFTEKHNGQKKEISRPPCREEEPLEARR